jgi:hypothetical protein
MGWLKGGPEKEPEDRKKELAHAFEQMAIWLNRAKMAWEQRNDELVEQALGRVWNFQKTIATLEDKPSPVAPPDPRTLFGIPGAYDLKKCRDQISTWRNRAAMAWKSRNDVIQKQIKWLEENPDRSIEIVEQMELLAAQALTRMWEYQVIEAKLEDRDPPPPPPDPENYFKDWGTGHSGGPRWGPFDPSRVPKEPLPHSGGGEVSLPLPKDDSELL